MTSTKRLGLADMEMRDWGHADVGLEIIGKAFAHAACAGGLRALARNEPAVAEGLLRVAAVHEQKTNALLALATASSGCSRRR
jgi:hypothetical protein